MLNFLKSWGAFAFLGLFLGIGLYTYSDILVDFPYLDDFPAILQFSVNWLHTHTFAQKIYLLFEQNNDFKLLTMKLIMLSYLKVFGQYNFVHLRCIGLFLFISSQFFMYKIGNFEWKRFYLFLPIPLVLLAFSYSEIVALSMESLSHFVVIFFAVLLAYLLHTNRSIWLIILVLFFTVYSNGNGLLMIPIGLLYFVIKKEFKNAAFFGMGAAIVVVTFFNGYISGTKTIHFEYWLQMLKLFFTYVGGVGGITSEKINFVLGVFASVCMVYFLFRKKTYTENLAVLALLALFFGTYFLVSVKRFNPEGNLVFRGAYIVNSLMIYALLYVLFYRQHLVEWRLQMRRLYVLGILGTFTFVGLFQIQNFRAWRSTLEFYKNDMQVWQWEIVGQKNSLFKTTSVEHNNSFTSKYMYEGAKELGIYSGEDVLKKLDAYSIQKIYPSSKTPLKIDTVNIENQFLSENPFVLVTGQLKDFPKGSDRFIVNFKYKNGQKYKTVQVYDQRFSFRIPKSDLPLKVEFNPTYKTSSALYVLDIPKLQIRRDSISEVTQIKNMPNPNLNVQKYTFLEASIGKVFT
ncbi:MAG: hypothetical protein ACRCVT_15715, partial [Leadbetterella sp.]